LLYHWLLDAYGPFGVFVATALSGLMFYLLLSGGSYLIFFVWKRDTFVPDYESDMAELRRSVKWALIGIAGNSILIFPVQMLIVGGYGQIYYSFDDYGLVFSLVSLVGAIVFTDTAIYWIHRALHTRFLYRTLHVHHHSFREPTPMMSVSFHPLDSFTQSLPYHVYALLVPMHFSVYVGLVAFVTVWTVMIHDRIRWVPFRAVNNTGCHTAHHWFFDCNYGQFFSFWDRLCGTYRDPMELPAKYFASRVALFGMAKPLPPRP
jgi:lathosterol oxidase